MPTSAASNQDRPSSSSLGDPVDSQFSSDDIAIIGLDGRFPEADDLEMFWENLVNGKESIRTVGDVRVPRQSTSACSANERTVNATAQLKDAFAFDAAYFGISPGDATLLDPQHRILLESVVKALEDAGCPPKKYEGVIGLFAGASCNGEHLASLFAGYSDLSPSDRWLRLLASDKDFLAARIAYQLDLKGPVVTLQAACATSLFCLHSACQSLLNGECDLAIAGAASVFESRNLAGYEWEPGGATSQDGHVRPFDASANGTVFGEGVGTVVLMPLDKAIAERRRIRAVIKGSAINNDGATKVGFTAPSVDGQAAVIAEALEVAQVDASTVSYIEAHGTGTELGDPIEVAGLKKAFALQSDAPCSCTIGSVKSNVGHLYAAAGMASLAKVCLAFEHELIPRTINHDRLNPHIEFGSSGLSIASSNKQWVAAGHPKRAGISSFGLGGFNAHVVLQAPPTQLPNPTTSYPQLLVWSAKSRTALEEGTEKLATALENAADQDIENFAYTLVAGREHHPLRRAAVIRDRSEAAAAMRGAVKSQISDTEDFLRAQEAAFLFSGQGSQVACMGRGLYERYPVFQSSINQCSDIVEPLLGIDVKSLIFDSTRDPDKLGSTAYAQPTIFSISYSLAKLWEWMGVKPTAMMGHSLGEYVAASLSGIFSIEDALMLVTERGRMMQALPAGRMIAVLCRADLVEKYLSKDVELAAVNGPTACTLSGHADAIAATCEQLSIDRISFVPLKTSHAFHSRMMEPMLDEYREILATVSFGEPQIPMISNVTGTWMTAQQAKSPDYWVSHIRSPVQFLDGLRLLNATSSPHFLEVGPGRQLQSLANQALASGNAEVASATLPNPDGSLVEVEQFLSAAGRLHAAGVTIDLERPFDELDPSFTSLPTYSFDRTVHAFEESQNSGELTGGARRSVPVLDEDADTTLVRTYSRQWSFENLHQVPPSTGSVDQWILVHRQDRLSEEFRRQLDQRGERYAELADWPDNAGMLDKVQEKLAGLDKASHVRLCYFVSPLPEGENAEASDWIAHCHSELLLLLQQLRPIVLECTLDIAIITVGTQDVTGAERSDPLAATSAATCRAIGLEWPQARGRLIDVGFAEAGGAHVSRTARKLLTVLALETANEIIALRGNLIWKQEQNYIADPSPHVPRLTENGTYLITGGTGALGLALAEYLANRCKANIALLSRSGQTVRPEDQATTQVEETISKCAGKGASVSVYAGDVTDVNRLREVITEIKSNHVSLNGVFHLAGIADSDTPLTSSPDIAAKIFAPKVLGACALEKVLAGEKLELFVLYSSISASVSSPFLVSYAAANEYLNALARGGGVEWADHTVSIGWDMWRDAGMAVDAPIPDAIKGQWADDLTHSLTNEDATSALDLILNSDLAEVVVSKQPRSKLWPSEPQEQISSANFDTVRSNWQSRPNLEVPYAPPNSALERSLVHQLEEALSITGIGIDDNFFDLGGHSLLAVKVIAQIRDETGVELAPADLLEHPTIRAMAALVDKGTWDEFDLDDLEEGMAE